MQRREWIWVGSLALIVAAAAVGAGWLLISGTRTDTANTPEKIAAITDSVTLDILPAVAGEEDVAATVDQAIEISITQTIPDAGKDTKTNVSAGAADAALEAAEEIRASTVRDLRPTLEEQLISGPAAERIVDLTLANLSLVNGDSDEILDLRSAVDAATGVALETFPQLVGEEDRPLVESAAADALTVAIQAGLAAAAEDAIAGLPASTTGDLNNEKEAPLEGSVGGIDEIALLPVVSGFGALALQELLKIVSAEIIRERRSAGVAPADRRR